MNNMQQILIVDDEPDTRATLRSVLESENYRIFDCATAEQAKALIKKQAFATLLIDIYLSDYNGIDLAADLKNEKLNTPVIIITGSSDLELARKALRIGVFDYLLKPFRNRQLLQVVHNAVMQNKLMEEKEALKEQKRRYQADLEKTVEEKIIQLKESRARYRSLVEQSLVGVCILQQGTFRYVNEKMGQLLDTPAAELIQKKDLCDFVAFDQKEHLERYQQEILAGKEVPTSCTLKVTTPENNQRILEMWAGKIQYNDEPAIESLVMDVTVGKQAKLREKRLEMELLQEHKLAAIGQLAAGIAHNLNTPISVIQGVAELIRLQRPEISEIDKILRQTARMTDLINSILGKSRREQDNALIDLDLNQMILDELEFFNANLFFKHNIKREIHLAETLPKIKAVYSDFSQAFDSIIQNAIDAVYDAEEKKISVSTEVEGNDILIKISDSGSGIKEEDRQKIFDPFFTTKPMSTPNNRDPYAPRGTGLGLSQAYTLLNPYRVKIELDSVSGRGTTFTLRIPVKRA